MIMKNIIKILHWVLCPFFHCATTSYQCHWCVCLCVCVRVCMRTCCGVRGHGQTKQSHKSWRMRRAESEGQGESGVSGPIFHRKRNMIHKTKNFKSCAWDCVGLGGGDNPKTREIFDWAKLNKKSTLTDYKTIRKYIWLINSWFFILYPPVNTILKTHKKW